MKRLLIALAFLAPWGAYAGTDITPQKTFGCGTIAVTTSSIAITAANVTLCPGTTSFPGSALGIALNVVAQIDNTANVILCPTGGTCATVGLKLSPGMSVTKNVPFSVMPPTAIAVSGTQYLYIEWQQ